MANNFFLSQDPLLFQRPFSKNVDSDEELQRQMNETMNQYKLYQQQQSPQQNIGYDYLGELDKNMKDLSQDAIDMLNSNEEYASLNQELNSYVQKEMLNVIKWKLNNNTIIIQNVNRQIDMIKDVNKNIQAEQRKNMSELNDYVKNYSNITFDEYKKIKEKNENENNKKSKKQNEK